MVTFDAKNILGADKETLQALTGQETVHSDEEYREFIKNHPLPEGYVWGRSPFGTEPGSWKVHCKEEPEIKGKNTDLEQQLENHLKKWAYRERFEHDYRHLGYQLDFADPVAKIALEPGATYWHTPNSCRGETKEGTGESPADVYFPPTTKDVKKQRSLDNNGWRVLWINENGIDNNREEIRNWLAKVYN